MMVISVLAFVPVRLGAMVLTTYTAMKKTMALFGMSSHLQCPETCLGTCAGGPRRPNLNGCAVRHIGVRRRLRNLPVMGELLAAADKRARDLPSLSRGCGRFPHDCA